MEECLLVPRLHGARDIAMPLLERLGLFARGAKQVEECVGIKRAENRVAASPHEIDLCPMVAEIREVELIATVRFESHYAAHLRQVCRLAVRGEPHHLVLIPVMWEAEKLRHCLVERAER